LVIRYAIALAIAASSRSPRSGIPKTETNEEARARLLDMARQYDQLASDRPPNPKPRG